ncbi:MAG: hypothetical protein M0R80_09695 [Proteobacteria bacterium]|jgi:hypothetical protein|nr:hypothetical protein [Pseudomonadota bacterium]
MTEYTIRAFNGDTSPIDYILRKRSIDSDLTPPIDLSNCDVYFYMYDEDGICITPVYTFDTNVERDDYFTDNPNDLIRGLLIQSNLVLLRYDGTTWNTDYKYIMNGVECEAIEDITGGVRFYPTSEEFKNAGMFSSFYRVKSTVDTESVYEKYPKGEKLWVRIMK